MDSKVSARLLTDIFIVVIVLGTIMVIFQHQIFSYLAVMLSVYVLLAAIFHHKKQTLKPEVMVEYAAVGFIMWFVLSSVWGRLF